MQLTLTAASMAASKAPPTGVVLLALLAAPAAAQLSTASDGYRLTGTTALSQYCFEDASQAFFADGSYLVFDGYDVEHRTASGALLRRLATFPTYRFPSFVRISDDLMSAYIGESSLGGIFEIDLASGQLAPLASLNFNFDFAFDATPGLAYVSAATGGFGTNSLHRLDLFTGATSEVALLSGFSGPLTVTDGGDVIVADITDQFPFPADSCDVLRFSDADLDSGAVLTETNATETLVGFDGISSVEYDPGHGQVLLMETNTGGNGFGSILWRVDLPLERREEVAGSAAFAGSIGITDAGLGTAFGPYQPDYVGVSFNENDCFGVTGLLQRVGVTGARPSGSFQGPFQGQSGSASFDLAGGPPNGFAALWIARSGALESSDVIAPLGGEFPIALRADVVDFGRRFPMVALDATGAVSLPFFQDAAIEGAILAQWIVFDATGAMTTSSSFAINRSPF